LRYQQGGIFRDMVMVEASIAIEGRLPGSAE
jgi:hypothetical protein